MQGACKAGQVQVVCEQCDGMLCCKKAAISARIYVRQIVKLSKIDATFCNMPEMFMVGGGRGLSVAPVSSCLETTPAFLGLSQLLIGHVDTTLCNSNSKSRSLCNFAGVSDINSLTRALSDKHCHSLDASCTTVAAGLWWSSEARASLPQPRVQYCLIL